MPTDLVKLSQCNITLDQDGTGIVMKIRKGEGKRHKDKLDVYLPRKDWEQIMRWLINFDMALKGMN